MESIDAQPQKEVVPSHDTPRTPETTLLYKEQAQRLLKDTSHLYARDLVDGLVVWSRFPKRASPNIGDSNRIQFVHDDAMNELRHGRSPESYEIDNRLIAIEALLPIDTDRAKAEYSELKREDLTLIENRFPKLFQKLTQAGERTELWASSVDTHGNPNKRIEGNFSVEPTTQLARLMVDYLTLDQSGGISETQRTELQSRFEALKADKRIYVSEGGFGLWQKADRINVFDQLLGLRLELKLYGNAEEVNTKLQDLKGSNLYSKGNDAWIGIKMDPYDFVRYGNESSYRGSIYPTEQLAELLLNDELNPNERGRNMELFEQLKERFGTRNAWDMRVDTKTRSVADNGGNLRARLLAVTLMNRFALTSSSPQAPTVVESGK